MYSCILDVCTRLLTHQISAFSVLYATYCNTYISLWVSKVRGYLSKNIHHKVCKLNVISSYELMIPAFMDVYKNEISTNVYNTMAAALHKKIEPNLQNLLFSWTKQEKNPMGCIVEKHPMPLAWIFKKVFGWYQDASIFEWIFCLNHAVACPYSLTFN